MSPGIRCEDLVPPAEARSGGTVESGEVVGRFALALSIAASVAVTVFACWAGGADFLLLVGTDVLGSADASLVMWSIGVLGCAGSLVLVLSRRRVHSAGREARGAALGAVVAVALFGTGTWCVARAVVVDGLAALGPNAYTVLRAPAATGCLVVAHEIGQVRSSHGDLYTVGLLGYAQPAGAWEADEVQLPVRDGNYSLQWNGDIGTLVLRSSQGIRPDRLQLSCTSSPVRR